MSEKELNFDEVFAKLDLKGVVVLQRLLADKALDLVMNPPKELPKGPYLIKPNREIL